MGAGKKSHSYFATMATTDIACPRISKVTKTAALDLSRVEEALKCLTRCELYTTITTNGVSDMWGQLAHELYNLLIQMYVTLLQARDMLPKDQIAPTQMAHGITLMDKLAEEHIDYEIEYKIEMINAELALSAVYYSLKSVYLTCAHAQP